MPLRAYINDKEVISIDLSDEQWAELKEKLKRREFTLKLPCCKQNGYLKISRGIKHFAHEKSCAYCEWQSESPALLKTRAEIIEACRKNRWKYIPEYHENDWQTDVIAIKNNHRIAFETSWKPVSLVQIKNKQETLQKSGVHGCWFLRTPPKDLRNYGDAVKADKEIPAFKISENDESRITAYLQNAH